MKTRRALRPLLTLMLLAAAPRARAHAAAAEGADFFETRIRPVLAEHCFECHSAARGKTKGGLALDAVHTLKKGGASGPAVVAGDPDASLLIRALRYTNEELEMPPTAKLPAARIADFEAWVKMGAPVPAARPGEPPALAARWRTHWSFQPPRPDVAPPEVRRVDWVKTPIDRFILAKLEAKGLTPSAPADRRTLLRRATFDLLGLPPTEEEISAFLADRSPRAFAKVVDRLLASPHYGERWGRHWLDVARYADTKGYVYADREDPRFVHSFTYRDWVIRALNEDLPYDRFLVEQLAADQSGASAASEPDCFSVRQQAPRRGREDLPPLAAMGFLTVGRRFINNIHDIIDDRIDVVGRGLLGMTLSCARCHDHKFDPVSIADYYSLYGIFAGSTEAAVSLSRAPKRTPDVAAFEAELARRRHALEKAFTQKRDQLLDRLRAKVTDYLVAVLDVEKLPTEEFYQNLDTEDVNPVIVRNWHGYLLRARTRPELDAIFAPWQAFAELRPAEFAARAQEVARRLAARAGSLHPAVSRVFAASPGAPPASMREVAERYGRLFAGTKDAALLQVLHGADSPVAIPPGPISEVEWFFDEKTRVAFGKLQLAIDSWILEGPGAPPYAVSLVDKPQQVEARVFRRGNPATKGEAVPRRLPAVTALGAEPRPLGSGSGRLELARALTSGANPLTARVIVNRVWQHHFGEGLVRTPSDFGLRSDPPSHPELLDWLARRFVADGWSWKKLHRLIVLSSAYQQASDDNATARLADPTNTLLWRANRRRLDFEEMRDSLLAVAGRLDRTMGGRPVSLTAQPASRRRTVYGFIDRLNLPGMMRTFDFAGPDVHSPQRLLTTVPQQALFMMNGAFVAEQARHLARRPEVLAERDPERRIQRLYRIVLGRLPSRDELRIALGLVEDLPAFEPPAAPPRPVWSYGCGTFDGTAQRIGAFHALAYFSGDAWSPTDLAYQTAGRCQLTSGGGRPGAGSEQVVVRRFTAPEDMMVSVSGTVAHKADEGDGIEARIIASRTGALASWTLRKLEAEAKVDGIELKKGDTLDFVVSSRGDALSDSFRWAPVIKRMKREKRGEGEPMTEWSAAREFGGPASEPLDVWDKIAQVLLETNEFVFVD